MKTCLLLIASVLVGIGAHGEEPVVPEPTYYEEAPLPEGWPKPGPYNVVSEKQLPEYRAAFTGQGGGPFAFWTLFRHIKRNGIPMTSPVEMAMEGDDLKKSSMGFFYQNTEVGKTGPDGKKVEVRNVPATRVLSYTWQGRESKENIATAKAALEAALLEKGWKASGFRLMGYNGPGTPRDKRTWELQALLEEPVAEGS